MIAATGIRYSGLEHVINKSIEQEIDPLREGELDRLDQLVRDNRIDEALAGVNEFLATDSASERALLLQQELRWRKNDRAGFAETTEKLCAHRLAKGEIEAALKDYETMVDASGSLLSPEIWYKLCQALDAQHEHERALGEYQELALTHPDHRLSLMALMNGAKLALYKLQRPQQAVKLYEAAASSPVPHMELEPTINSGLREARATQALGAHAG
jgi:tetratricopeptide (TPR) repeat protein